MTEKRNMLSRQNKRKLEDLIIENRRRITSGEVSKKDFAKEATKAIGHEITVGNLIGACKAVEIEFPANPATYFGQLSNMNERLNEMERRLAKVEEFFKE